MKKLIGILIGVLVVAAFAAPSANAADDIIKRIKSRGVLRVCEADYPPYNFKDPKTNEWGGLDQDMAANLAEKLKVKLESVDAVWGTLVENIVTDKCDISVAATYVTPERAERVLYSGKLFEDAMSAYVPIDSPYKTWESLDQPGRVIGVWAGAFEEPVAKTFFKKATLKLLVIDKISSALIEVANKRIDAYFSSIASPARFIVENPQIKLRILGDKPLKPIPIAFIIPPGEYQFQQYVNVWLEDLHSSGVLDQIRTKWLGNTGQ